MMALQGEQQQNACMPSITIRDVPQEVRDELAARAARSGRSLQDYLRAELIELAFRPDQVVLVERIRERKRLAASSVDVRAVLADRNAERE
jgi:plasmid stability protein